MPRILKDIKYPSVAFGGGLRHVRKAKSHNTRMRESAPYLDRSLGLLDRLERIEPVRQALQQEVVLYGAGLPADVRRAYYRLLHTMHELGLPIEE